MNLPFVCALLTLEKFKNKSKKDGKPMSKATEPKKSSFYGKGGVGIIVSISIFLLQIIQVLAHSIIIWVTRWNLGRETIHLIFSDFYFSGVFTDKKGRLRRLGVLTLLLPNMQYPDTVICHWHCDHSHVHYFSQHNTLNTFSLNEYSINKKCTHHVACDWQHAWQSRAREMSNPPRGPHNLVFWAQ